MGRAAVMTSADGRIEMREYPLPDVAEGCILAKVNCCTICGSDVHSWAGSRPVPLPIILGHEIVGTIVRCGPGVSHDCNDTPLRVGDRITWTLMDSCGRCYYCRIAGLPMKCRHLKKYGHDSCGQPPHFLGGFSEYCYITPGTCCFKLPDNLPDEVAAPANCALSTVIAAWEAVGLSPFENVLIQGAGALGIYGAALARHYGCNRIIVSDILDHRLDFIKNFGVTDLLNTNDMNQEEIIDQIQAVTEGKGVDCILESAGIPDLIPLGLKCLRKGGRYAEVGCVFPRAQFQSDAFDLVSKMITVKGVHNYDARHLHKAVHFLHATQDRFPFHKIITHRIQLEDVATGLNIAKSGEAIRVAVIP
ncbi:MAG: zinc-binding dehydrogenase [Desulfohalobiaceae bacterium]|nr:zinc-binding dehydrogenase [Desulfohalobiaceae bacterium]